MQGFRNDSVSPEEVDDDPELILDGSVHYAKPLIMLELGPEEEKEMAVDEEEYEEEQYEEEQYEEEEEERNSLRSDKQSFLFYRREQSPFREEEAMSNPYQTLTQAEIQQQVRLCVSHISEHVFTKRSSFRAEKTYIRFSGRRKS